MKRGSDSSDTPPRPELPALDWIHRAHAEEELLRDVAIKVRRRRQRNRLGVAAALFALVFGGLAFHFARDEAGRSRNLAVAPPAAGTIASEPRTTAIVTRPEVRTLPDGTTVELNAAAEITVAFTPEVRHVTLVRGAAHFQVASNPARPFVVHAGNVEARAVGTAFAVQFGAHDIGVLVTEGKVRVTPLAETGAPPDDSLPHALVEAGHRCVVEPNAAPRVETLMPANVVSELAWRIPQLEFSRTPLHEVIALVNEQAALFGRDTFELADPGLRNLKLTGLLRADNTGGFERLLETSFHLHLERMPGKVLVRRAQ